MTPVAIRGIAKASALIASVGVAVKLLVLGRDISMAQWFGTSLGLDGFVLAFAIITFFVNVFLGTFNSAFVPTYLQVKRDHGARAAGEFQVATAIGLSGLMALTALALYLGSVPVLRMFGGTLARANQHLLLGPYLLMLPLLVTGAINATIASALNAERRFVLPALAPALSIAASLAGLWGWGGVLGTRSLAIGLVAGGLLETGLLWVGAWRAEIPFGFGWGEGVRQAIRSLASQYVPVMMGALFMASTSLVDLGMAALMPAGGVSSLAFGNRLPSAILNLCAVALSTAALPYFSRMVTEDDWEGLQKTLRYYLKLILVTTVPVVILLILFSKPLVQLAFQRGAFTEANTELVSRIQMMYALQIPFYVMGNLLVKLISALRRNRLLLYGTILSAVLNVALNLLFLRWLGVMGIALSTSCVFALTFLYKVYWVRRLISEHPMDGKVTA